MRKLNLWSATRAPRQGSPGEGRHVGFRVDQRVLLRSPHAVPGGAGTRGDVGATERGWVRRTTAGGTVWQLYKNKWVIYTVGSCS